MKTLWREAEAQLHKWKDKMDEMKAAAAHAKQAAKEMTNGVGQAREAERAVQNDRCAAENQAGAQAADADARRIE